MYREEKQLGRNGSKRKRKGIQTEFHITITSHAEIPSKALSRAWRYIKNKFFKSVWHNSRYNLIRVCAEYNFGVWCITITRRLKSTGKTYHERVVLTLV